MSQPYIHHGTMFSYYSAKTRAYLSYKGIDFVERYDGPDIAKRISKTTHKVMIPIVETPSGEILQDTTAIIDALEATHPEHPVLPTDPVLVMVTRIVEFIIDELWVCTAMNTRWNDPASKTFAIAEFGRRIGGSMGLEGEEALATGQRVADLMQSYLPYLGIGDAQGQLAATEFFEQASKRLNKCVGADKYAFGERPSLIDMCLYTGYYAHHYRDIGAAASFLKQETPDLCYFIDNMHAVQCAPKTGELRLDDTFINYLEYVGPAGAAFAQGIYAGTAKIAEHTELNKPFAGQIPPFPIDLGKQNFTRGGSTFSAWKAQRIKTVYDQLEPRDKKRANQLASDIGWSEFLNNPAPFLLAREDYQIVLKG